MKKALSHEFLCDSAFLVHRPGLVEHLLHLPALEEKVDALTARILQRIVGSKET